EPGAVVSAAADGDEHLLLTPEVYGSDDVGDVGAARDETRPLVDHAVVESAYLVVVGVVRPDEASSESLDGRVGHEAPMAASDPFIPATRREEPHLVSGREEIATWQSKSFGRTKRRSRRCTARGSRSARRSTFQDWLASIQRPVSSRVPRSRNRPGRRLST